MPSELAMKCVYNREVVEMWSDDHLKQIHHIQEGFRADGTLARQGAAEGRAARFFALIVRDEMRKRNLGS